MKYPYVDFLPGTGAVVEGTQVPVRRIYGWYAEGVPIATILKRYPQLRPAQVHAVLAYGFDHQEAMRDSLAAVRDSLANER
jgi:uncharacterized protein (DUF433 family)